ncbi:MAG: hypothetical protein ACYCYK_11260 [Candidatus Dormibacteria bacterium]
MAATADLHAAAARSERWRRALRRHITPWVTAAATAAATVSAVAWAASATPNTGGPGATSSPAQSAWARSQARLLKLQQGIDSDERQIAKAAGASLAPLPAGPAVHATTGASGVVVP